MADQSGSNPDAETAGEADLSTREMNVLLNIATVVSAASSMNDVYSSFAALVADLIEWDGISFTTLNDDGKTFSFSLREGAAVPVRSSAEKFPIEGTLHGEAVEKRETQYFVANNGQTAELALKIPGLRRSLLAGFRTFMATPLFSQGEVVGGISVQSFGPHAFSARDQMLFERIASFVGPTLGRFNAFESLQKDDLRNKSLLKIGQLLLGSHDLGEAFDQLVDEMRTVVDVDRLTISVAELGSKNLVDRHVFGVHVPGNEANRVISLDSLQSGRLDLASHGYIFAETSLRDADPLKDPRGFANYEAGLRSAMFAALRTESRLVGTINLKSTSENAYVKADLEYFEQVADHVAASVDRTLAHESKTQSSSCRKGSAGARQKDRLAADSARAKDRLLASTTRGMRSPLAGMLAFIDLLARNRRGNLDEKQVRYLSIVRRNAEELSGLVRSLTNQSEMRLDSPHINPENFELAGMLNDAIATAAPKLAEQGATAEVEVDDGIKIVADRRRLIDAIGELIDHGSGYVSDEAPIQVVGKLVGSRAEFSVIWPSPVSSLEFRPPVIDRFKALGKADAADGLGMAPNLVRVRAVAAAHGGDAIYELTPDNGARFTIRIPAHLDLVASP